MLYGSLIAEVFFILDINYCTLLIKKGINTISQYLNAYGSHPDGSNINDGELSECGLQDLGVIPRIADSECSKNEYAAGVQIPVGLEASPRSFASVAGGNIEMASYKSSHSIPELVAKGFPAEERPGGVGDAKAETKLTREGEVTFPVLQNCRESTSTAFDIQWLVKVVMFVFILQCKLTF